jgi:serine/threonine-protein kinase
VKTGDILAGKYRVEQVLGVGGMGVVVAAFHMQLGQRVALKFLLPQGLANTQVVARFEREARAAAQLRSEHVARVIDVGHLENGGGPYIVMELLGGTDLSDLLIARENLPEDEAVDYVIQACEAIAEAHALGIVHRDLKPKNLFVTQRVDGTPLVKVLDFGISKTKADDLSLTGTTEVIGSPNYMSPEQLRASREVDARSDIWSIGAILYELLGGRVPFVAETLTQLCSMVLTEPPRPLEELRPDVHPELRRVVDKCLQKRPDDRFSNVGELAMALAPFATPTGSILASRVAVVAGAKSQSGPLPHASSSRVAVPGQNTSVSWGATEVANSQKGPRAALFVGGLFAALAAGGLATAILFATGSKPSNAPPVNAGSAPTVVVTVTPAPEATPTSTSTPNVSVRSPGTGRSTDTSTGPAGTLVTPTPASASASTSTKKPPAVKPVPALKKPTGDDLPMERK